MFFLFNFFGNLAADEMCQLWGIFFFFVFFCNYENTRKTKKSVTLTRHAYLLFFLYSLMMKLDSPFSLVKAVSR